MSRKKTGVASAMALPMDPILIARVPVAGPVDGLRPPCHALRGLVPWHGRLERARRAPVGPHFGERAPEADAQSRKIGGAQRRSLRDLGTDDRHAEQVRLE